MLIAEPLGQVSGRDAQSLGYCALFESAELALDGAPDSLTCSHLTVFAYSEWQSKRDLRIMRTGAAIR